MTVKSRALLVILAAGLAAPPAPAQAPAPAAGSGYVNFNFDQVELRLLVKVVGEMTGRRFVLDEQVNGKVTVVTPQRIPVGDAYPLLVSILESTGLTVVERGDTYQVVRLPEAGLPSAPVVTEGDGAPRAGLITKVIRVANVSVVELRKLLEPLVRSGKAGGVAAFPPTNHLIITDTAENIRQIERILAELDRPGAARVVEVIPLQYGSADEIARQLVAAMKAGASASDKVVARHLQQVGEGAGSLPSDVVVVPSPRANGLIIVGTPVQLKEMRAVVAKLDVQAPSGYGRLHAIFLKYLSAEEAAKSLNALLAKTAEKDARAPISLEPNVANNALIVDASPQDFDYLQQLVAKLDQIPQQVLVEVVIAEITMDKSFELGAQWSTVDQPADDRTTIISRSRLGETDPLTEVLADGIFPRGVSLAVAHGTFTDTATGRILPNIPIYLQALAQNQNVKILSSVPLWAQNNAEATVNVVENIPLLRSTIEGGSGTARDVIQNIDRVDVGIKLKVKPHVNPDGDVTLELNPAIEAIIDEGPPDTPFAPTIAKREVSTTVTVPNKATVVISGLMREDEIKAVAKIPLLGDLPLIGWLFRSKSDRTQRTNLLIFVTPHIVTDMKVASQLQQEIQERTKIEAPPALHLPLKDQPVPRE